MSATSPFRSQPDVSTPARQTAVRIEDGIRRDSLETGALIGVDGALLAQRSGAADRVSFSEHELAMAEGGTFTHNHPAGKGPSVADAKLGIEFALREVRVVTVRYRYGLERLRNTQADRLEADYTAEEPRAVQAVCEDIKRGLVNRNDFGPELVHRCWERVSSRLGFVYWRDES